VTDPEGTLGSPSRRRPTSPPPIGEDAASTRVAVVLASAGRPSLLAEALATCSAQCDVTFEGVVSVPDEQSLPSDRECLSGWRVVTGVRGLAAQRNAALDTLDGVDIVAFFDDDAVLRPDYVANAVRFLDGHPHVVGLTGRVLLDGATTGEVDRTTAASALAQSTTDGGTGQWRESRELYGCNFVVRFSAAAHLRFDARLPLYSWLEDHDYARRLMKIGTLAKVDDCVIVHRAAASGGRQAHLRLGYSQVMNPVYLNRKGSFPAWLAAQQILRPVAKNIALAMGGSSRSWRRERLRGNGTAVCDIARGRITPERIVEL
jgi:GT2 family glycosyltransferase